MQNLFRKTIAALLCFNILFSPVPAALWATDITGIQPVGDGHTYNIEPDIAQYGIRGETGFRTYENFSLDAGDTANLLFTDGYSSFVNVVDNQININGFLNTVKGSDFYAGKAYFITKSGIVIGSSGVLNVGSLGLISSNSEKYSDYKNMLGTDYAVPGSDIYRELFITVKDNKTVSYNTSGDIKIDGTIFAREAVKAYANSISVKDRGIVAGWNPSDGNILFGAGHRSFEDARTMFNALVSGDINSASFISNKDSQNNEQNRISLSGFAYQQGDKDDEKWKGSLAEVNISNAHLVAPEVQLEAGSFVDSKHLAFDLLDITGGVFSDYAKARLLIDGSRIKSNTVSLISQTKSTSTANANALPPVLWVWLCNLLEDGDEEKWESGLGTLFSSDIFKDFDGTRSYSYLDIKDSQVLATGDIGARAEARSEFTVETTLIPEILPQILYALGTETEAQINVDNSKVETGGNVGMEAVSENKLSAVLSDDSGIFKFSLATDAYNFRYVNVGTSVNTGVNLNRSIINARDIKLNAFSYEDVYVKSVNSAAVGKNDFQSGSNGGSGAAFSFVLNNSDINTSVEISDSTLNAGGSITVRAENAAAERAVAESKTTPSGYKVPEEIEKADSVFGKIKNAFKYAKGAYDKVREYTVGSISDVFKKIFGKASGQVQENVQNAAGDQVLDPALFQAAGSFVFSFLNNTNNITISKSGLKAVNGIDLFSHIFDLSFNSALALSRMQDDTQSAIVGAGIAVVVNDKENTNDIVLDNSELETSAENGSVSINAITEIPGNAGSFGADHKYLHLSVKFNMDANDEWTADFEPWEDSRESMILPTLGLSGFFSNEAMAGTNGDKAAVSASVVVNSTKDNTNVTLNKSEIKTFDFKAYATNFVTVRDSVGIQLNAPASGVFDLINLWNSDGTGGSVLVQNMNHNAAVNVKDSKIELTGSADIGSASAQAYFNFLKQGTKAGTVGLSGAVEVQNIKGTTAVNITDNSTVSAQGDISVNAGKTKSVLGDMTYKGDVKGLPKIDTVNDAMKYREDPDSPKEVKPAKVFDITDHITTIDVLGDMSQQTETKSVSAAVGVTANIHDIDRDIQAVVDGSTLNAGGKASVDAYSSVKAIELAIAAAVTDGGKPTDNNFGNWQNNANNAGQNAQNAQNVENPVRQAIRDLEGGDGGNGVQAAGGAAGGASSSFFSLAATGAVNVFDNNQRILSVIRNNSQIRAGKSVSVSALADNFNIFFSGGLAKSGTAGLGSAVNLNTRGGSVKALIDFSEVKAGNNSLLATQDLNSIKVSAKDITKAYSVAAGIAFSGNTESNYSLGVGGSFVYNMVSPEITASVTDSELKGTAGFGINNGTDVQVTAEGELGTVDIAGGIDLQTSGNITVGAAAAVTVDYMEGKTKASVENSVLDEKIRNVDVNASEKTDLLGVGVSLAIAGADSKFATPVEGSVGIVNIKNDIQAIYRNNSTSAAGHLDVKAENNSKVKNIEGAGQFSASQNGAGAGGAITVDLQNSSLTAALETGDRAFRANGVSVQALSNEELNSIPVGIAISKQSSLLSSTVSVGVIRNSVKAYLKGQITSTSDVLVRSQDQSYLLTRGGTLAASGSSTPTVIAAAVNVDVLRKDVEAKISDSVVNAEGQTVTVRAVSADAFGGAEEEDVDNPTRDDITSSSYNDTLMQKDASGDYTGIRTDQGFDKWNMFWNLAAGSTVPIGGTVVIKNTDNTVNAQVSGSQFNLKDMNVTALERQIKNIVGGQVSAGKTAAVGVQVVLTFDRSDVTASVNGNSDIKTSGNAAILASGIKDNNTVTVAAAGSGNASGNVNVMYNEVSDSITASMEDSVLTSTGSTGTFDLKATEDFNSTRVVVQAAGAGQGVAINVAPLVNDYKGTVFSFARNSAVTAADTTLTATDFFKTRDISVGVSGVGQGVSATGIAIRNNYKNSASAYTQNLTGSKMRSLTVDAINYINSNNWVVGVSFAGQGVALGAEVLINDVDSETTAKIEESDIETTDTGVVTVRVNKDNTRTYSDKFSNYAIFGGFVAQGAGVAGNFVFNYYTARAKAIITGSTVKAGTVDVRAFSTRDLNTKNISASGTAMGGNVGINITKTSVMADTYAGIDAKDRTVSATGSINVTSEDTAKVNSDIGSASIAGLGGAGLANVNLIYNNADSKAEIASSANGSVEASDVSVVQNAKTDISATDIGIAAAIGAVAGDVTIVRVGNQETYEYSTLENNAGVGSAESSANSRQNDVSGIEARDYEEGRGFAAQINANVKAADKVKVISSSSLNDYSGNNAFNLSNVNVSAGAGALNVGWLSAKMYFANSALISGGNVSAKNIQVEARENDSAQIDNVKVQATILGGVAGGISSYSNNSVTNAVIKDSALDADTIDVVSDVKTTAKTDVTDVQLAGGATINVAGYETLVSSQSNAIVTGNADINARKDLNITAKESLEVNGEATLVKASLVTGGYMANRVEGNASAKALVKDLTGTINAGNLNLTTAYDRIEGSSRSNVVSVSGIGVNFNDSKFSLNPVFTTGIDSLEGGVIKTGNTNIVSSKALGNSRINALTDMSSVSVDLGGVGKGGAYTLNKASSATLVKAKDHEAENINVDANLSTSSTARMSSTGVSVVFGVRDTEVSSTSKSLLSIDFAGSNTAKKINVEANHDAETNASMGQVGASLLANVSLISIAADNKADTSVNIGGQLNASDIVFDIGTDRTGILNLKTGNGGFVGVSSSSAANSVTGSSVLTIDGYRPDILKTNNITLKNVAVNRQQNVTSDSSGGFVNVSESSKTYNFNTQSKLNLKNSDIRTTGIVSLSVESRNIVEDDASSGAGGVISVAGNSASNSYSAGTELNVENTEIEATDVILSASSDISTAASGEVSYKISNGGFIPVSELNLSNTLTQNNAVNIRGNSFLRATRNFNVNVGSGYGNFKQIADASSSGFITVATVKTTLTSNNTNTVTVENGSTVRGDSVATFSFASNGNLRTYSHVKIKDAGSDPETNAKLYLTVNNNLNLDGTAEAGKNVNVSFMEDSVNNLSQESYSEHYALAPFTTEGGELQKTVNNTLNISTKGRIISGKDVYIGFGSGRGDVNSNIHYHLVYYSLFGKESYGHSSNAHSTNTYNFDLSGKIIAGYGNNKKAVINTDGSVNIKESSGLYASDYVLYGPDSSDIAGMKREALITSLNSEIETEQKAKTNIETSLESASDKRNSLTHVLESVHSAVAKVQDLIEKEDYQECTQNILSNQIEEDFEAYVQSPNRSTETTEPLMAMEYLNLKLDFDSWFRTHCDDEGVSGKSSLENFVAYAKTSLSDKKKATLDTALYEFQTGDNPRIGTIEIGEQSTGITTITYYNNHSTQGETSVKKMIATSLTDSQSIFMVHILDTINTYAANISSRINYYSDMIQSLNADLGKANDKLAALNSELESVINSGSSMPIDVYAIAFNPIKFTEGKVTISGIDENRITPPEWKDNIITGSGGLEVQNYSNRAVLFDSIDFTGSSTQNGISVRSYADTRDPFYSVPAGVEDVMLNDIYFLDSVTMDNSKDLVAHTTSGSILMYLDNYSAEKTGRFDLRAEQGSIDLIAAKSAISLPYAKLYAGNSMSVSSAKTVSIDSGSLTVGNNSDRKLRITEEMLQEDSLVTDPTTGEKNMLNLSGTDYNVNAVYKDGTIFLFNIGETGCRMSIEAREEGGTIGESVDVSLYGGSAAVDIVNETSSPLVLNNIDNIHHDAVLNTQNVTLQKAAVIDNKDISNADVYVDSNSSLSAEGRIISGAFSDGKGGYTWDSNADNGSLSLVSNSKIFVDEQFDIDGNEIPAIITGSTMAVVSQSGEVEIEGIIHTDKIVTGNTNDEPIFVRKMIVNTAALITRTEDITLNEVEVKKNGLFISNRKNIILDNEDVSVVKEMDIQLFTGRTGAFSLNVNSSNRIETTAPVVIVNNRDFLVWNFLGYHSFDTLTHAETTLFRDSLKAVPAKVFPSDAFSFGFKASEQSLVKGDGRIAR